LLKTGDFTQNRIVGEKGDLTTVSHPHCGLLNRSWNLLGLSKKIDSRVRERIHLSF